jgi:hypothetical protein
MGKLIARLKFLVDWAGTVFLLIGWLGWTAVISGLLTTAVGVIWAIIIGVPKPIVIMAGYCTIAGTVVLAMAPLAFQAFSRMAAANVSQDATAPRKPNAAVWHHLPKFTLYQAACLLADITPASELNFYTLEGDALAWQDALSAEMQSGQISYIATRSDVKMFEVGQGDFWRPGQDTEIDREELKRFAERHGIRPRFLFP